MGGGILSQGGPSPRPNPHPCPSPDPSPLPHRERGEKTVSSLIWFFSLFSRCGRGEGSGEEGRGDEGLGGGPHPAKTPTAAPTHFSSRSRRRCPSPSTGRSSAPGQRRASSAPSSKGTSR